MTNIVIWDLQDAPSKKEQNGKKFIYLQGAPENKLAGVSINTIIDQNSEKIRKEYLEWVNNLRLQRIAGRELQDFFSNHKDFNYWWMSLLQEKCNLTKSPHIYKHIQILALNLFLRNKKNYNLHLFSNNQLTANLLKKNFKFSTICTKSKQFSLKHYFCNNFKIIYALKLLSKSMIYFYFAILCKVRFHNNINIKSYANSLLFIGHRTKTLVDLHHVIKTFWGELPNVLYSNKMHVNWLWINMPTFSKKKSVAQNNPTPTFNNNVSHYGIEEFIDFGVLLKTMYEYLRLVKSGLSFLFFHENRIMVKENYWVLYADDFYKSIFGYPALQNCLYKNLLQRVLPSFTSCKGAIYLFEGMGWESAFLSIWRGQLFKKSIGFAHSFVRFWDLRYFVTSKKINQLGKHIYPDFIAVNNIPSFKNMKYLFSAKYSIIKKVESLRFSYLKNIRILRYKTVKKITGKKKKILLILGDYRSSITNEMLNLVDSIQLKIRQNYRIYIRAHPFATYEPCAEPRKGCYIRSNKSLAELLKSTDVVFSSVSTSAYAEVMSCGIPLALYSSMASQNLAPIQHNHLPTIYNERQLQKFLERRHKIKSTRQKIFYEGKNLTKWLKLINRLSD